MFEIILFIVAVVFASFCDRATGGLLKMPSFVSRLVSGGTAFAATYVVTHSVVTSLISLLVYGFFGRKFIGLGSFQSGMIRTEHARLNNQPFDETTLFLEKWQPRAMITLFTGSALLWGILASVGWTAVIWWRHDQLWPLFAVPVAAAIALNIVRQLMRMRVPTIIANPWATIEFIRGGMIVVIGYIASMFI